MKYCGRWNTTVLAVVGGKAMMLTVLRGYTELVEECDRYSTTLCKGCVVVFFMYMIYVLLHPLSS